MHAAREAMAARATVPPEVELMLYDNHYRGDAPLKSTDLLYRSATAMGVWRS
jgi:hypothetical protein